MGDKQLFYPPEKHYPERNRKISDPFLAVYLGFYLAKRFWHSALCVFP